MVYTSISREVLAPLLPAAFDASLLDHPGVRGVVVSGGKAQTFGPLCRLKDWTKILHPQDVKVWEKPAITRTDLAVDLYRYGYGTMYACAKLANVSQSALSRKLRKPQAFVCPCCGAKRHHQGVLQATLPRQHKIVDDLVDGALS